MRFDEAAITWDDDPIHVERANQLAQRLIPLIRANQLKSALDFGAGTGLPSFFLRDYLDSITLIDLSEGMIQQAQQKIDQLDLENVKAICGELTATQFDQPFDLIYTLMTLHHIQDLRHILTALFQLIAPGGFLCIADLDKEDGSFHDEFPDFDGHNGFDQEALMELLHLIGFAAVQSDIFYTNTRKNADGTTRSYPVFLMIAYK